MNFSWRGLVNQIAQAFDRFEHGPDRKETITPEGTALPFKRQPGTAYYLLHTNPGEEVTHTDGTRETWQNGRITQAVLPDGSILRGFKNDHFTPISAGDPNPESLMTLQRGLGWRTKEHPDGSITTRTHSTSVERREYPDGTVEFSRHGQLTAPEFEDGAHALHGFNPARIRPDGHKEYWLDGFKFADVTPAQTQIFHESNGSRVEVSAAGVRSRYDAKGSIEQIAYPDGTLDRFVDGLPVSRSLKDSVIHFDTQGQGVRTPSYDECRAAYAPFNELAGEAIKDITLAAVSGRIVPALLTTPDERAQGRLAGPQDISIFNQLGARTNDAAQTGPADAFGVLLRSVDALTVRVGNVLHEAMENPAAPSRQNPLIAEWADRLAAADSEATAATQPRRVGKYQRLDA